jgi:DNA (cytosine-5)-methyltransferase 1
MGNDRDAPLGPVLSLFSGSGGLDLGFEAAGFKVGLALDADPVAVDTYNWNRRGKEVARVADLATTSPRELVRLWESLNPGSPPVGIVGGPPCQAFSIGNVHKFAADPRSRLPLRYAAILREFHRRYRLRFFLFENVAGLRNKAHADSLSLFLRRFRSAGFPDAETHQLDAVDFGVPQYRKRVFIAGFDRSLESAPFHPPTGNPWIRKTVRDTIGHLPAPLLFAPKASPMAAGLHPNHWCMVPRSQKFLNSPGDGAGVGRSFRILDWDAPSWTVAYGHREVHIHPSRSRRLSVLEAMLLQGFPAEYVLRGTLSDQIRLVSDAVPPPLAKELALSIKAYISGLAEANAHTATRGHSSHNGFRGLHMSAPRSTNPSTALSASLGATSSNKART